MQLAPGWRELAGLARLDEGPPRPLALRSEQGLARLNGGQGRVSLTQTEMARRVGASREKVNRKLHAFAAEGWVAVDAAGVRLLAPERLKALAGL